MDLSFLRPNFDILAINHAGIDGSIAKVMAVAKEEGDIPK